MILKLFLVNFGIFIFICRHNSRNTNTILVHDHDESSNSNDEFIDKSNLLFLNIYSI